MKYLNIVVSKPLHYKVLNLMEKISKSSWN